MKQSLLVAALLTALTPGVSAAPAAPGPAALAPASAASLAPVLEVCRLPGSLSEYSGKPIAIPAGTVFSADAFDDAAGGALDPGSGAQLKVATTASVAIAAAKFCVDAPVKPLGGAGAGALHAALGRMFIATSAGVQHIDATSFDNIYGLLLRQPS
ncbi:MAG TPA: hypothetical protein VE397_05660 [Stellaceae bacterium]|nr:hypothetical protein [Stellaceae bacterium]